MTTLTFQQNLAGYSGTSDTMLRASRSDRDYRDAVNVNVDGSDSAGTPNQGLLEFADLFGTGPDRIPAGATITSATLTLQVTEGTSQPVALHRMLGDWSAGSDWSWNGLGAGVQADGVEAAGTADVTAASLPTGSRDLDVTASVQAWADGAANHGWAFLMDGSNGWDFSSSEGGTAPLLSVTYDVPTTPDPALVVTETGGATIVEEGGDGDTVAVALAAAPTADVTITISGGDDIGAAPVSLVFTPGNWQTPQSVALAAIDDALVEGNEDATVVVSAASSDAAYDGLSASIDAVVVDDDLETPPPGGGGGSGPATVSFQQGVGGYADTLDTMLRESRAGNDYRGAGNVNVDGSDSGGGQNQGLLQFSDLFGSGAGQIPLGATITSAQLILDVNDGTSQPVALHRMLADWSGASSWSWNGLAGGIQTDGVEARAEADVAAAGIAAGVQSLDVTGSVQAWAAGAANHGWAFVMDGGNGWDFDSSEGATAPRLVVSYDFSTAPSPAIALVETGGATVVTEGGSGDVLTLALTTAPTDDVTLTVTQGADISAAPSSVTFTSDNWHVPQEVALSAVDDLLVEGSEDVTVRVTSTSADAAYDGLERTVDAIVIDNDSAPPPGGGGGGEDSEATFQQGVNGYAGTVDTMLRESRAGNDYRSAGNVNVDGSDSGGGQNQGLLQFSDIFGSGPGQIPLGAAITSAELTLQVSDGTSQQVSMHRMLRDWSDAPSWSWNGLGNGIQTDGTEAVAAADVSLGGIAAGSRTIDVTQSVQAWASGGVNHGWAFLMEGSNGWDFNASEGGVAPRLAVSYDMPSAPTAGIAVTQSGNATVLTEGGSGDLLTVTLNAAPTANVTVNVALSSAADATASPGTLTFTAGNWQTPQQITLAAIDDDLVEGTETLQIELTSSSADPDYDGRSVSVTASVIDDDSAAPPELSLSVVAVHATTDYSAGDPSGAGAADPSGIAYVPGLDLLFIADSEHDESPFNSPINLFAARRDGTFVDSFSMRDFTDEPTGLAYNPVNGFLYVSDDDADRLFWVDPSDPETALGSIDVDALGIEDAEDPAIDPATGNIYMLDGVNRGFFELTAQGGLVRQFTLPSVITDPEGLAFDARSDTFYFAGGATRGEIFRTDRDGNLIDSFDLLNDFRSPITGSKPKIKGLELAASSDPDDGDEMSLYAVNYGNDQFPDGQLFEIDLGSDWLLA